MKNPKTTITGLAGGLYQFYHAIADGFQMSDINQIVLAVTLVLLGAFAKDHNKVESK